MPEDNEDKSTPRVLNAGVEDGATAGDAVAFEHFRGGRLLAEGKSSNTTKARW